MKTNARVARWIGILGLFVTAIAGFAAPAQVNILSTNWMDRWITNQIEVRMPRNRFVNEYQTNWVDQLRTNVVPVYATNRLTLQLTNIVPVDVYRTNYLTAYQTNYKTLQLTNWVTVLVFKTNWVQQPLTNLVQIELSQTTSADKQPTTDVASEHGVSATAGLTMEAKKGTTLASNNQVEVLLKVKWTNNPDAAVQVQQWKVEREDGSILCFGQEQEFKRALPIGKYKVQVKAQPDDNGQSLAARGLLAVSSREVTLQPKPAVP